MCSQKFIQVFSDVSIVVPLEQTGTSINFSKLLYKKNSMKMCSFVLLMMDGKTI